MTLERSGQAEGWDWACLSHGDHSNASLGVVVGVRVSAEEGASDDRNRPCSYPHIGSGYFAALLEGDGKFGVPEDHSGEH